MAREGVVRGLDPVVVRERVDRGLDQVADLERVVRDLDRVVARERVDRGLDQAVDRERVDPDLDQVAVHRRAVPGLVRERAVRVRALERAVRGHGQDQRADLVALAVHHEQHRRKRENRFPEATANEHDTIYGIIFI